MVYAGAVVGELAGLPPFTARGLGLYQGRHIYVEDLLAFESGEYRKDAPQWLLAELGTGVRLSPRQAFFAVRVEWFVSRISVGVPQGVPGEVNQS